MINVGLNGLGRIGRAIVRINDARRVFRLSCINDIDPQIENHAYLLRHDSTYGRFAAPVERSGETSLKIRGETVHFHAEQKIVNVPWQEYGIDIVIDASGVYDNVLGGRELVDAGRLAKVVYTHAPRDGLDATLVFGVNEGSYNPDRHHLVGSSICDVNAIAPVLNHLDTKFGVAHGFITTLHPWLSYQNLLDGSMRSVANPSHFWSDFSLGRDSTQNLIPKDTTVVKALGRLLPDLARRLDAISFRTPLGSVAAADMTIALKEAVQADALSQALRDLARTYAPCVGFEDEALVSSDFRGNAASATIDGRWVRVNDAGLAKLVVWYDNEWAYSQRVVDLVALLAQSLKRP